MLTIGGSKCKKVYSFGFFMENHDCWCLDKKFGQVLSPKEVKNTLKMTFLPLISHIGSSLGRLRIWRGKWAPNSEIPLGLESRQVGFFNKHTWDQFGLHKMHQNQ